MRNRRRPIHDLRTAIDCMPVDTRVAMLEGITSNEIIVGAYTDRSGGVCPMLAAHRCGGRTDLLSFARAWDRFTHAKRARRATDREMTMLVSNLEASLFAEESIDFTAVRAEHEALRGSASAGDGAAAPRRRPGDRNRTSELKHRPGWAWMRPFRRYDEYKRALDRLEAEREAIEANTRADAHEREHSLH